MEKTDWLALENTQELIRFIKDDIRDISVDAISGTIVDQDNSDKTQYMNGKLNGIFAGYSKIMGYLQEEKDEDS